MADGVEVEQARAVSAELVAALTDLVPQLSSSSPAPTVSDLEAIVRSPATRLLIARDGEGKIVGSLTLALFRIPTGVRAWIEDVVVDRGARGGGVGNALVQAALRLAREHGARTVDLTSRASREDANRLYRRAGFQLRETNVYRFELERGQSDVEPPRR